ncbi:MAG: DciA family protein [Candidatus Omnitrophica bacterium]|nr:DciA family protein [Candidatus Omnitrophota bacterium]MCM8825909.1 DciA family protein [Candidatus Omnitrophota bacterium]
MTVPIKNIIKDFLIDKEKELLEKENVRGLFKDLLETNIKQHLLDIKLYKKNLILTVDSSVAKFQLNLLKEKILNKIKEKIPYIEKIKIKL